MFVYLDTSQMSCLIYGSDLYNLQTRKKSEIVQTVQGELSIHSNTAGSQI